MKHSISWFFMCVFLFPVALVASDYPLPTFLSKWGSSGGGAGEFFNPRAAAVSAAGYVYVADSSNDRVQRFFRDGTFIDTWGMVGTAEAEFDSAEGVAADSSGDVYVSDWSNHRIQKFDADGSFLFMWGWAVDDGTGTFQTCTSNCEKGWVGSSDGQFNGPARLAVDAADNIYVVDTVNQRIQKFDKDGTFLGKWGAYGTADTQFNFPGGIAVGRYGEIYVSDQLNHRLQRFDSNGNLDRMWGWGVTTGADQLEVCMSTCLAGKPGSGDGQFNNPSGIAVDARGDVYVADQGNHRVQKFHHEGALLMTWGSLGTGDGQFNQPSSIAVSRLGEIFITDQVNQRIQRFKGDPLLQFKAAPVPSLQPDS